MSGPGPSAPGHRFQQLRDRASRHRVYPVGCQFGQRLEHEPPVPEPWMRHREAVQLQHRVTVQNQIEIDRPRGPGVGALASEIAFDGQQGVEGVPRRERRETDGGGVQEAGLRGIEADGVGLVKRRDAQIGEELRDPRGGRAQVALAIAKVATKADGDARRLLLPARGEHSSHTLRVRGPAAEHVLEPTGGLLEQAAVLL